MSILLGKFIYLILFFACFHRCVAARQKKRRVTPAQRLKYPAVFADDILLLSAFGKDDFIHEEENDHRDAAVQNGGADVVDSLFVKNSCDFYTDSKSKKTAKIEPGSSRLFPWVAQF